MAGEDRAYTDWVRRQHCHACFGPGPCEAHHATHGLTYSPDEPRPAKALEGRRRGKSQKAHDHYSFALHVRCHGQFHNGKGQFSGWTNEQLDAWQSEQVNMSRAAYALHLMRNPPARAPARAKRKPSRDSWIAGANAEREACALRLREYAAAHYVTADQHAALVAAAENFELREIPYATKNPEFF